MLHRFDRLTQALFEVINQTYVMILVLRVFPGDHKDGMALLHQITHQGVMFRQIKNVILHYPRRHHQHWLSADFFGVRTVLNKLQQVVFEHYLARCDGNIFANPVGFLAFGLSFPEVLLLDILDKVINPFHQVSTSRFQGFVNDVGVSGRVVSR